MTYDKIQVEDVCEGDLLMVYCDRRFNPVPSRGYEFVASVFIIEIDLSKREVRLHIRYASGVCDTHVLKYKAHASPVWTGIHIKGKRR